MGKDNLWALKPHPILRELGFSPPKSEIHSFKYEHEKACADVFVTFSLSGRLYDWQQSKKIGKSIIPDRTAGLDTATLYIEVEMGSQDKIRNKADAYRRHYDDTGELFEVCFLVKDRKQYESGLDDLRDFSNHYLIELLDDFHHRMCSDTHSDTHSD